MIVGSFFSGIGLLDYGLSLAGVEHAWFCEADPFRRDILRKRWPGRPVYDDVRTVGAHNAERVTGIVGGFPCKGASTAGKRNGFDHAETVLWREMFRAIGELRPGVVVVENVANLLAVRDGAVWGEVLGDLASLGFDVVWDCIPAAAFGAPHRRDRVIAIATHPASEHRQAGIAEAGSLGRTAGRSDGVAAYPERDGLREQPESERRSSGTGVVAEAGQDAANTDGTRWPAGRQSECPEPARDGHEPDEDAAGAVADAAVERRAAAAASVVNGGSTTHARAGDRGVAVEWGPFAPAIARWASVVGPAPEPLLRRMDDRGTARVERSRLSALGDGVQVQLGELVGRYLMSLEARAAA